MRLEYQVAQVGGPGVVFDLRRSAFGLDTGTVSLMLFSSYWDLELGNLLGCERQVQVCVFGTKKGHVQRVGNLDQLTGQKVAAL